MIISVNGVGSSKNIPISIWMNGWIISSRKLTSDHLSKESDEIIHKLSLKIYEAEYRILMVWLPEKLHPTCANKLLKIIEEPPMKTVILMVSETPDLILGTIQSRAQRIHIRPIETDAIMNAMVSRFGLFARRR